MHAILALALKDLALLLRQRGALFFTLAWPLITAIAFGFLFGGMGSGVQAKPKVSIADLDASAGSARLVAALKDSPDLEIDLQTLAIAEDAVRTGKRSAVVVIPKGFGEAQQRLFYGETPSVELMCDPSRTAERGLIEGMLMRAGGQMMASRMTQSAESTAWIKTAREDMQNLPEAERAVFGTFFDSFERVLATQAADPQAGNAAGVAWEPLKVTRREIEAKRRGPRNGFAVTFPQGMLWGIVGCLMSFATGLVLERVQGTLLRLRASPMSPARILAGKALACFLAILLMQTLLVVVARTVFNVQPNSYSLLVAALFATAICFTGFMMLVSSMGKTVEAMSGAGWALLMPLMMIGGGMIPLFVMPAWMAGVSHFSPVKWGILALEGAIWRGFSFYEMLLPLGVLFLFGAVFLSLGSWLFTRRAASA